LRKLLAIAAMAPLLTALIGERAAATGQSGQLRRCQDLNVGTLHVFRIRTNYRCVYAHEALRRLLRDGVSGLPARKASRGAWACRKQGSTRICTKLPRRHRATTSRILFRTEPTVPQDCLDLWNAQASHAFQDDGLHFYVDHGVRKGWVFHTPDGSLQLCAVIFVVPVSDWEYGTDGEVTAPNGGWQLMNYFFGQSIALQNQAPDHANVSLDPSGKLARL
jgi:hypothetical protein